MFNIVEFISNIISSEEFLLTAELFSFCCKFYLLIALSVYCLRSTAAKSLSILLIIFLSGALLNDIGWIITMARRISGLIHESKSLTFIARIGWALFLTQHQALSVFLSYLIEKKFVFKIRYIVYSLINIIISSCFLYLAFFKFNVPSASPDTLGYEVKLIQASCFMLFPLLAPVLYNVIKKIKSNSLPKILTHQLKILISFLILPHLFLELITNKVFFLSFISQFIPFSKHTLLSISTVLCSYAIYYCSRSIMGLRFLNASSHVESQKKFNFINDFKDILEQLSYVTSLNELAHLTQIFFKTAFEIPVGSSRLYIKKIDNKLIRQDFIYQDMALTTSKVESFLLTHNNINCPVGSLLKESKIFIKDEIEFSNFYDEQTHRTEILNFLDSINADIFLPIYEQQSITAYIIVDKDARPKQLYNSSERDEMIVFTSYLSNIINILKHSNLEALLRKEKDLTEELYLKHQEINQYKESIRSFLRTNKDRKIGIVFYKSRRFTLANQAAQELITIDINTNQGHPLTQAFKNIARKVQEYKSSQTIFSKDEHGNKLILAAIPSLEQNNVIILVYYPEATDIIKAQLDLLKDPSTWDYLLYLETTQSGQLINQLIPGTGENLLNFKIDLLATALSKKATLLQLPEDDLIATVEILHHISLRQKLHIIKLTAPEKNHDIAIKLFGINPLIQPNDQQTEPLLEKLNNIGTLFIQNIHFLSLETQQYLAEFITYGFFHRFKSDHKIFSNVRIICSSNKNLQNLVADNLFSKNLFNELKKTSINFPSLASLSDPELANLVQGFTEQALKSNTFKNLLSLNEKDKYKLLHEKPVSLHELKTRVQQILTNKSNRHHIQDLTEFDPAYNISDPELAQAVRLGKKALKDPKTMIFLWDKFKNQNKIATLLGVNRSSVNRRCKKYNLH